MKMHATIEPSDYIRMVDLFLASFSAAVTEESREALVASLEERFADGIRVEVVGMATPPAPADPTAQQKTAPSVVKGNEMDLLDPKNPMSPNHPDNIALEDLLTQSKALERARERTAKNR